MKSKRFQAIAASVLITCCVISEIAISNTPQYKMTQDLKNYSSDYAAFKALKARLDERENSDKYRMELSNLRTRMDPCWYNYNGLSAFSSMAYEKVANLQRNLGMYGNYINSFTYYPQTAIYNSMFSLKYLVKNDTVSEIGKNLYTYVTSEDKFDAYQNKYCLPIAYCVNNDISDWKLIKANSSNSIFNPFENQLNYFEKATGISDVFEKINVYNIDQYNVDYISDDEVNNGSYSFSKIQYNDSGSTTLTYKADKTENIYAYFKSSDLVKNEITITRNGTSRDIGEINTAYIIDLGLVNAGEEISIDLNYENDTGNVYCYVYALNMDKFEKGYEQLSKNSFNVTTFTDTKIEGNVTADKDCVLYTSIPYDTGWKVTIDGNAVSDEDIISIGDALLGIKLSSGYHDVKLQYKARGLSTGIVISALSVIGLIVIIILAKKSKKRKSFYYSEHDFIEKPVIKENDTELNN